MLASSLKTVFEPEPTDRFDSLLQALDERARDDARSPGRGPAD